MRPPDYAGGSLVNLVAELERRLTGESAFPPLHADVAAAIPEAGSYVLVLFDGLGADQLARDQASTLRSADAATLQAPFPTTTTVAVASVATGMPPMQHALIGYELWLPDHGVVANTIHWRTLWGEAIDMNHASFLPAPNLWERLRARGAEAVTVQPGHFAGSPMSLVMYRGARYEPAYTYDELVDITVDVAGAPGRLIYTYFPNVDVAAHRKGMDSDEYKGALSAAASLWERLATRLPDSAALVGTSDHGQLARPEKIRIPKGLQERHTLYGDGRVIFVHGDGAELADELPATWVPLEELTPLFGPGPAGPDFARRAPQGALLADDGKRLLHRHSDARLISAHGGLTDAELLVPLLVSPFPERSELKGRGTKGAGKAPVA